MSKVNLSRLSCFALMLSALVAAGSTAKADLLDGLSAGNAETVYTPIQDVELKTYSTSLEHPYEVIVPNTVFGNMIVCLLLDADGQVLATEYENSGRNETHVFFMTKEPAISAACANLGVVENTPLELNRHFRGTDDVSIVDR